MGARTVTTNYKGKGSDTVGISAEKGADDAAANAAARDKYTGFSAAKAGAGAGGGSDMPKQNPGESAAAFGARMRDWRARKQAAIR